MAKAKTISDINDKYDYKDENPGGKQDAFRIGQEMVAELTKMREDGDNDECQQRERHPHSMYGL